MINDRQFLATGIDIGSTTAKLVVIGENQEIILPVYQRHHTKINQTIREFCTMIRAKFGDITLALQVTGSAGMGLAERLKIPFIQEVIATTDVVRMMYPDVKTLIDIGGEDSKMIFFHENRPPDIRMNGSCAGGTGAFIDQMAVLMNREVVGLNALAAKHTHIHTIASRCGVFAKTDVQNLLSRKISHENISASIFHAIAVQTLNTLARGQEVVSKVMFTGGPFTFLPELARSFKTVLGFSDEQISMAEHPELLPAIGAALSATGKGVLIKVSELEEMLTESETNTETSNRLTPLFHHDDHFADWKSNQDQLKISRVRPEDYKGDKCFLGIDSGSTTTKIIITGTNDEILFEFYKNSKGNPIETVEEGLLIFREQIRLACKSIGIAQATVTGYGEDLIKAAFGLDHGIVETIAHFTAARHLEPNVSFILDIGGQDMKAMFIQNGIINRVELNESCSSGCGSFIETFGNALGHGVADFATMACEAQSPCDLGTRCTVFMNSKVKQSLRENATVEDISAGLAISVVKNALFKVLKLRDTSELGEHIVVQGGTFKNLSVRKALEDLTGKKVLCADIPELMGAYGSAIYARQKYLVNSSTSFAGLDKLEAINAFTTRQVTCKGCENLCNVTRFNFENESTFYSGNKCEKIFQNQGYTAEKGTNFFDFKLNLLFDRNNKPANGKEPKMKIGIPRVLNMYSNFPFWNELFTHCGIELVLSDISTMPLYETSLGTVMSDSICFPAKLVHGHITNLSLKQVDRIFYPMVFFEQHQFENTHNTYNCPIVSSYPDVVKSAINPLARFNLPIDSPTFNFKDAGLLKKACSEYLKTLGISKSEAEKAFAKAIEEMNTFRNSIQTKATEIIEKAKKENRYLVVLAGRPYHVDPLINHKTGEILSGMGVDVLTEDAVPVTGDMKSSQVIMQWAYPNYIYNAAHWVAGQGQKVQFVQLNSFGCGPDAIAIDECADILKAANKNHTLIRVDDITSTGSVKLRLRSLIESLRLKELELEVAKKVRKTTANFTELDKDRTILAPYFADIYSDLLPPLFALAGYKMENLPKPDKESVQFGLKYTNNEICYPATIIVGDVIKNLQSGKYDRNKIAIAITQTGGQCRATSYLGLIRKAMIAAGYEDVPVISINSGTTDNTQPGFKINWLKMLNITFSAMLYCDCLTSLYYSTAVREKQKGESKKLLQEFIALGNAEIEKNNAKAFPKLLEMAVSAFNHMETDEQDYPRIGVVGEIYVKYNSFGHRFILEWLMEQGVEVCMPPIIDFFIQAFVNTDANQKGNLERKSFFADMFMNFLEYKAQSYIKKVNKIMSGYKRHTPFHDIRRIAEKASNILSLTNQFGEGWLIPAEISAFAKDGVNHVISLQPFGCIANHVISKGVEKRIRDLYPDMDLLFLDFDDGASEVNILNRLHFMVKNVKELMVADKS
jgi:predicted CoA-substrate-specific enzyme activase